MTQNKLWQDALAHGRALAQEAHCRYCDNAMTEPERMKCAGDIRENAVDYARALLKARAEALREAAEIMYEPFPPGVAEETLLEARRRIEAHAAEYERAAKEGK